MSDDEHDNGEEGDFADWNEEEEAETRTSRCLFSSATHPNPTAALTHAADAHGFDLRALTKQYGLDFYGTIMALNYARTVAKDRGAGEGNRRRRVQRCGVGRDRGHRQGRTSRRAVPRPDARGRRRALRVGGVRRRRCDERRRGRRRRDDDDATPTA
jgi:hypothetical protein